MMKVDDILVHIRKPIDLLNLEKIIAEQPYYYQLATEEMARIKNDLNMAKYNLDLSYSKVYLTLKEEAAKAGAKMTEAQAAEQTRVHPEYQKASQNYFGAKYAAEKVDAVRKIFEQRESAISNLVKLYGSQYWSMHEAVNTKEATKTASRKLEDFK